MLEEEDFRASATSPSAQRLQKKKRRSRSVKKTKRRQELDEDGFVHPLSRLCLLSLADNMKAVWVKDYEENYLDRYHFTYIMGPFDSMRESSRADRVNSPVVGRAGQDGSEIYDAHIKLKIKTWI